MARSDWHDDEDLYIKAVTPAQHTGEQAVTALQNLKHMSGV